MHRRCTTRALSVHRQRTSQLWGLFLMEPVQLWTGHTACALQAALRMTNESFAAHLGTAVRTVATWHQKSDRVPSAEMQQALDTTLERAGVGAQARFTRNTVETTARLEPTSQPLDSPAHAAEDEI